MRKVCLVTLLTCVFVFNAAAETAFTVHGLFSDHMVLQRDRPVRVWGTAEPGSPVSVEIGGQKKSAAADASGKWRVRLDSRPAGGPFRMTVSGPETCTFSDVWYGDVWLCSGQSNMDERLPAKGPFCDKQVTMLAGKDPELGKWCERVYAARNELVAESATPEIRLFKVGAPSADERGLTPETDVTRHPHGPLKDGWQVAGPVSVQHFSAVGFSFGYYLQPHIDVKVGLIMSARGGSPIVAWTPFDALQANEAFTYKLAAWDTQEALYKPFRTHQAKKAEFQKNTSAYWATPPAERGDRLPPPPPMSAHARPGLLYNGMIHPLVGYAIKGALWYQGEADSGGPTSHDYRQALAFMVRTWRERWGIGDFSFYCVQLCAYTKKHPREDPGAGGNDSWVAVQNAQLTIDEELTNSGGVVSVDLGRGSIHPRDKVPIGQRLALMARARTYGEKELVYQGPVLKNHRVKGSKIILTFDHVGSGIMTSAGQNPDGFAISADGKTWFWAEARITGRNTIEASHPEVATPKALRYSWHRYPWGNVINKEGLPARGFEVNVD